MNFCISGLADAQGMRQQRWVCSREGENGLQVVREVLLSPVANASWSCSTAGGDGTSNACTCILSCCGTESWRG